MSGCRQRAPCRFWGSMSTMTITDKLIFAGGPFQGRVLREIKVLERRPVSLRSMREQAEFLDDLTKLVAENWYDLPYRERVAIRDLTKNYERGFALTKLPRRRFREVVENALAPLWESFMGDNSVYKFAVALANFLAAVERRVEQEAEANRLAYEKYVASDPAFAAIVTRPVAGDDEWVDWRGVSTK